jgi:hypothetical protein
MPIPSRKSIQQSLDNEERALPFEHRFRDFIGMERNGMEFECSTKIPIYQQRLSDAIQNQFCKIEQHNLVQYIDSWNIH